jgi:chemotaxis protein histidine kinase CheA
VSAREDELVRRLRATFAAELEAGLRSVSRNLVALRETRSDIVQSDLIASLLRTVHGLKGAAESARTPLVRSACHRVEDVLDAVRDAGAGAAGRDDRIDLLLATVAALDHAARRLADSGATEDAELAALVPRLERAALQDEDAEPGPQAGRESLDGLEAGSGRKLAGARLELAQPGDGGAAPAAAQRGDTLFETFCAELARAASDLAEQAGKRLDITIEGAPWRVDDRLAASLREPLRHLVRNAVDHGLEAPEQRAAAGKAARGCITIVATPRADRLEVSVADDGAGIDLGAVAQAARARGLPVPASDRELADLVFHPGLSTRSSVTTGAGRGIGLDAVRAQAAALGGEVQVDTRPGSGTRFVLSVPVERARVPVMLVASEGSAFALPEQSVVSVRRVRAAEVRWALGRPYLMVHGAVTPIGCLADLLRASGAPRGQHEATRRLVGRALLLRGRDGTVLLAVDRVTDPWRLGASARGLLRAGGVESYLRFLRRRLGGHRGELRIERELRELGPRLDLRLFSGVARLDDGDVIWMLSPDEIVRSVLSFGPAEEQRGDPEI